VARNRTLAGVVLALAAVSSAEPASLATPLSDGRGQITESSRAIYEQALAQAEATYGAEDGRVANVLNNYAVFEKNCGHYLEAEEFLKRALEIRTTTSGPDHPETAIILNNLGRVAQARGERAKAHALFERAIRIWESALGPDHPDVANGLANLGALCCERKRYREAEQAYRRALQISEHSDNGLSLARDLNNLGTLYGLTGRDSEAEPLLVRALQIQKDQSQLSPDLAKILGNLARVRMQSGAPEDAERIYREALRIWDSSPDNRSLELLPVIEGLTALLKKSGRYAEAEKLDLRATTIRVKYTLAAEQER
jgi:tetratricopeptide (TPR) repeat protein